MNFLKVFYKRSLLSLYLMYKIFFVRRRGQTLAAILSMTFGILPLILVQEISIGIIEGMSNRMIETSLYHISAKTNSAYVDIVAREMKSILNNHPDVESVFFEITAPIMIQSEKKRVFGAMRGIDSALLDSGSTFSRYITIIDGDKKFSSHDDASILVSAPMARKLGVAVGDELRLLSVNSIGGSGIPRVTEVRVHGIFTTGLEELEQNWIFVSYDDFSNFFPPRVTEFTIGVNVEDLFAIENDLSVIAIPDAERLSRRIRYKELIAMMRSQLPAHWDVATWSELGRGQFFRFQQTRAMLTVLMVIILVVSSIAIVTFLIRMTTEVIYQLKILKLLGVPSVVLRLSMFYFALLCGVASVFTSLCISLVVLGHINSILSGVSSLASFFAGGNDNILTLSSSFYLNTIPVTISLFRLFGVCVVVCGLIVFVGVFSTKNITNNLHQKRQRIVKNTMDRSRVYR